MFPGAFCGYACRGKFAKAMEKLGRKQMKSVLVLGATGMLGNAIFRYLSLREQLLVHGTTRSRQFHDRFPADMRSRLIANVNAEDMDSLCSVMETAAPHIVINCMGVIKQLGAAKDPLACLPVNAMLPHRLARLCALQGARLIHVSTDCVFDGSKGNYAESDKPDCDDLYGRSKLLGEVDYPHAITLRTSLIGHELSSSNSLIDWFLSQQDSAKGYRKAVFSGLPTTEFARLIADHVIPRQELHGLYHVSAEPISKYDLLTLVARAYGKKIALVADDTVKIDRSLNSQRFRQSTGYVPPDWPELVAGLRDFYPERQIIIPGADNHVH
jgi:dTDP-4-dehydrorhamnose reductase